MKTKLFLLLCVFSVTFGIKCTNHEVTSYFKRPLYEFSIKLLDKVAHESEGHFVFSPILTWFQLANIAEGAKGETLRELRNVTGLHRKPCVNNEMRAIFNNVEENIQSGYKSKQFFIIDKLYKVKKSFKERLERWSRINVENVDFNKPHESAEKINNIAARDTNRKVTDVVDDYDFDLTSILLSDAVYYKTNWTKPFNPVETKFENFYVDRVPINQLEIMTMIDYYNIAQVPFINAKVLEIPTNSDGISMVVFLPTKGYIKDLFYQMNHIRISTIYNLFKKKGKQLVHLKLPRFSINTQVDNLAELVNDFGVTDIFYPEKANLKGISDYSSSVSILRQKASIEVTEDGVTAMAESLLKNEDSVTKFFATEPFAYMLVDRKTDIILFAGIYSKPFEA